MSFVVRASRSDDLDSLFDLTKQFGLLNLPADKRVLAHKIEKSLESFSGKRSKAESEYLFVLEDTEEKVVVGSSLIMAKHGTEEVPHSFFKILKKNLYSDDLGVGFIHQVLNFQQDTDGPSEIGGLLVDRHYRRRPEKLGKQISLTRFLFMGMYPEKFEEKVLCELTPPLTEEGRSEFWEALGRRFTGLPYQEADLLSQSHKEFISSLFPEGDIYLSLLDAKARLVIGRVGEQTKPAQHLLESIGFSYLEEIDPFDGGPHFGAVIKELAPIKNLRKYKIGKHSETMRNNSFKRQMIVGTGLKNFRSVICGVEIINNEVFLPEKSRSLLGVSDGDEVALTPMDREAIP